MCASPYAQSFTSSTDWRNYIAGRQRLVNMESSLQNGHTVFPAGLKSTQATPHGQEGTIGRSSSEQTIVTHIELEPGVGGEKLQSESTYNAVATNNSADAQAMEAPERAAWGNQAEFILTMVGYAVGLGNVWRFPYLCYRNGGGAFLIPYFGTLALVGLPLFFMELAFGQFASLGPIAAWTLNPLFKGLGYSMVIINTMIGIYYNVIIAWTIHYFFSSMTSQLPWENCDNWWNTDQCVTPAMAKNMSNAANFTIGNYTGKTPSEEYFYNRVLQMSGGIDDIGTIVWQLALCLLLSWTIVFLVLIKGISSLGKVVYFSSIFPYVVLTIMLIRGVTLEGASEGILYYLKPDFSRLADARAWSDAATQIFFSLSTCTGGLMAMASYNPFKNNCFRDAIMIPIINCATSFYGGFAIFSVLGYMAHAKGVSVSEVAASGPGLVFVVFPEGLSTMPVAPLWSILFFIMMMTLGLSSEFSIIECFFSSVLDEFPWLRKTRRRSIGFRLIGCIIFYLIGLSMVTNGGFYIFNLSDYYIGGFPLLIVGLLECVALCHIYGFSNFSDDIEMMLGRRPSWYIRFCWCFMSPLILFVIIIFMSVQYKTPTLFSDQYKYPVWAEGIGWGIVFVSIILIPAWFLAVYLREGGWQLLLTVMKPTAEWGPASPTNRTGKYARQVDTDKGMLNDLLCIPNKPIVGNHGDESLQDVQRDITHQVHASKQNVDVTPPPRYQRSAAVDNEAFENELGYTGGDDHGVIAVTSFR